MDTGFQFSMYVVNLYNIRTLSIVETTHRHTQEKGRVSNHVQYPFKDKALHPSLLRELLLIVQERLKQKQKTLDSY